MCAGLFVIHKAAESPMMPLVARTVVRPTACEVTVPLGDTVAMAVLSTDQVTDVEGKDAPREFWMIAPMVSVSPSVGSVSECDSSLITAGAFVTVMSAVSARPAYVAITRAVPLRTATTRPSCVATDRMVVSDENQAGMRPVTVPPSEFVKVTPSFRVSPTLFMIALSTERDSFTGMLATCTRTVSAARSCVPTTRAVPTARPVTVRVGEFTCAIVGSSDVSVGFAVAI